MNFFQELFTLFCVLVLFLFASPNGLAQTGNLQVVRDFQANQVVLTVSSDDPEPISFTYKVYYSIIQQDNIMMLEGSASVDANNNVVIAVDYPVVSYDDIFIEITVNSQP